MVDSRRSVPGTDRVLGEPDVAAILPVLGVDLVKQAVHTAQQRARAGEIDPSAVATETLAALPPSASSVRRVLNASGVLLHTNLGRAPLSEAATGALREAAGATDVELDLDSGRRGPRGAAVTGALLDAVPRAGGAHVVNNGAAALSLAATALAQDREIVLSRGEMVEIGDGFRIPELLAATGARLREVGTTNRVRLDDYRQALGPDTGFVLKVHPSNFVISGFTSEVPVGALRELGVPVVADIGSGLLRPHASLPDEPDATSALAEGADLVVASGDKLLGGPQAGLMLGSEQVVDQMRRHPLARALRVDKLTLAALEATLRGPRGPVEVALRQDPEALVHRAEHLAATLSAAGIPAGMRRTEAAVGGGSAPGHTLPSAAVAVPEHWAKPLRTGQPPVLARVEQDCCLLDLAGLPVDADEELADAVLRVA